MSRATLRIALPSPCSEPWDGMRVLNEQQRHCTSCDRVITDFSQMSDDEIALWFVHSKGQLCGQFSPAQLDRAITLPSAQPRVRRGWAALWLLPLSLFAKTTVAQTTGSQTQHVISAKTKPGQAASPRTISGYVYDENNNIPLAGVHIHISDSLRTVTDKKGKFSLTIPAGHAADSLFVRGSYRYKYKRVALSPQQDTGLVIRMELIPEAPPVEQKFGGAPAINWTYEAKPQQFLFRRMLGKAKRLFTTQSN